MGEEKREGGEKTNHFLCTSDVNWSLEWSSAPEIFEHKWSGSANFYLPSLLLERSLEGNSASTVLQCSGAELERRYNE